MNNNGITWDNGGATLLAAAIAAAVVVVGYFVQQSIARGYRRSEIYAEALRAVNDYLEAQYLVRRHDGSARVRWEIVRHISDVQSRLMYYQSALVQLAPSSVADGYSALVAAARKEAGAQMSLGWKSPPIRRDRDVPIVTAVPHPETDAVMERVVDSMSPRALLIGRGALGLVLGGVVIPLAVFFGLPYIAADWTLPVILGCQAATALVLLGVATYFWPMRKTRGPALILFGLSILPIAVTLTAQAFG